MSLQTRLAALERRHGPTEPQIIKIHGGLDPFDDTRALIGADTLHRDPAEPFPAFHARALAAAKVAGEPFAIIGGLPV